MDGKFGTLHTTRRCSMATCGRNATMWMEGNNGGISGDCWRNGPPGMGGFSADVFGRGCCCGSEGAAGLVKSHGTVRHNKRWQIYEDYLVKSSSFYH